MIVDEHFKHYPSFINYFTEYQGWNKVEWQYKVGANVKYVSHSNLIITYEYITKYEY